MIRMKKYTFLYLPLLAVASLSAACSTSSSTDSVLGKVAGVNSPPVKPVIITEPVRFDSDDPAIWVNRARPSESLVIGTDKNENGALYVFNLQGKIVAEKVVRGLKRPNNVDVAYGLKLNGKAVDIAVTTERLTHKLRIYTVPDMKAVDKGGIEVFRGETGNEFRDLMGIALYRSPDSKIYAIVGRKNGPKEDGYLWQYELLDDGTGNVKAELVRKFGQYSGKKEIEAIAVDNELGYIYYSDEQTGIRQYYADPEKGNKQLSIFGTSGFAVDHEGISIYKLSDSTGYILVSDQGANRFQVFRREGTRSKPFKHELLKVVNVAARESDGSDIVSMPLNNTFRHGLFVVMSTDRTFHFYRWEDIAGKELGVK